MGDKKAPLQREFFWFFITENLGEVSQVTAAAAVRFSPAKFNKWRWHKDPSPQSLKQISKNIRDELGLKSDQDDVEADKFVDAFKYVRKVQNREAEIEDAIPELARSFMREMRFIDAKGRPSEKLIKWLNSTPPPLVAPRYISREKAFTENEATSAIWLNPHNHYSLPLVGRDAEIALLDQFIGSKERFKIAALVALSGAGKTRLVSQWAKTYIVGDQSEEWDAGFVESPNADLWSAENWQPSKNTLIIIDYTYNYAEVIGAIMKRFEDGAPYDIRLLILDHVLPEKLHLDTAFRKGVPSLGFREANSELFFETWPIALKPISDTRGFLCEIISAAADPFTEDNYAKRYKPDSPEVISAADALMEIGAVEEATATPDEIKRRDAVRHPLFAALLGQMIRRNPDSEFSGMTRRDLVGHYFENERRLPWSDDAQDPTLGYWVGLYVSAATLLRGVAINDILEFQDDPPETTEPVLNGRDLKKLRDVCRRFVSSGDQQVIQPFEPDILGETFVLKFLAEKQTGTDYRALASILNLCCQSGRLKDPVGSFLETVQRLVRNLINDDQEIDEVREAWRNLKRFLDPKWFPINGQVRQAISVCLGDVVRQISTKEPCHSAADFSLKIEPIQLVRASQAGYVREAALSAVHCLDALIVSERLSESSMIYFKSAIQKYTMHNGWHTPAVSFAILQGCFHAAQRISEFPGESLDAVGTANWTALMHATQAGDKTAVAWLISKGADPNSVLWDFESPVLLAAQNGEIEIMEALLGANADINCETHAGYTPLMFAARRGDFSMVDLLVRNGAFVDFWNENNETAISIAQNSGNEELMIFIKKNGRRAFPDLDYPPETWT